MKFWQILLFIILPLNLFGQLSTKPYTNEIRLVVDNDVFTSIFRDQYYSSGIFAYYRYLKSMEDSTAKVIRSFSLNQRVFTPQNLRWRFVQQFDRPYAGHLSVFLSNEYYLQKTYFLTRLELGWMGPGTLTGDIHATWHNWFGLPYPEGWDFQIENSPIINFYGTYAKTLLGLKVFDVISETNLSLGTAFTNARQEFNFRLGLLKDLYESVQYNGQLGSITKSIGLVEAYILYAPGIEYNINNTTIEGNFIGKESPHVEEALRWIVQHKWGFMFSWSDFDFQFSVYHRSKETKEASKHVYGTVQLNKRF